MASRLELHEKFCDILGTRNVYFQPPASVQMRYPAIVYSRKKVDKLHASNKGYITLPSYEGILIDKNPDSSYLEQIMELPYCEYDRSYTADNLNHDVFTIYNI